MKTEDLQGKGLNKEQIDFVMAEYGKDLNAIKAERDGYVTGDVQKEYGFTIVIVKSYSSCQDDLNLEAMNFAQAFIDWLDQQNERKDFPDFGEDCEVQEMQNLQNMPNLSGVNQDGSLARYMIQARIIYKERKKRT